MLQNACKLASPCGERLGDIHHCLDVMEHAGAKKFRISFDDGDEIWTSLPAKDVRPAASDLATAGRIPREGIPVQVVRTA